MQPAPSSPRSRLTRPASHGGLKQGDVITQLNGQKIVNASALQVAVSEMSPGTKIKLGVIRDGKPMTLDLTVGQFHGKSEEASNERRRKPAEGQDRPRGGQSRRQTSASSSTCPTRCNGVVVQHVRPGSPADDAGLQPGDVILEVDRKPAAIASQFATAVHSAPAGKDILLLVWSKGNASYRTVRPDQSVAQSDNNQ